MKKLSYLNNAIMNNDTTAAAATGISSKGAVGKVSAASVKARHKRENAEVRFAREEQKRKDAEKYGRDMYKLAMTMAEAFREYGSAEKARAEAGFHDINSRTVDAVKVQTVEADKKFIKKVASGNGAAALHDPEEYSVKAAANNAAEPDKKPRTHKSTAAATKSTATKSTASKSTASKSTSGKSTASKSTSGKTYAPRKKRAVKFEEEYSITAKNGVTYSVGKFERTDNGETNWAVWCDGAQYSTKNRDWLRNTFKVVWSQYAGGYLFNYKPDTYLKRGTAKKKTA